MSRMIVEAEAVLAWGDGRKQEEWGVARALVVSVTTENGNPVKGLGTGDFDASFLPPTTTNLTFSTLQIVVADEQLPGVYVLLCAGPQNEMGLSGKQVFAVMVADSGRMGQTLTSLTV